MSSAASSRVKLNAEPGAPLDGLKTTSRIKVQSEERPLNETLTGVFVLKNVKPSYVVVFELIVGITVVQDAIMSI